VDGKNGEKKRYGEEECRIREVLKNGDEERGC
jgi:hypothetical protein